MSKPDLSVRWSKREKALLYHWERDKPTSGLVCRVFEGVPMATIFDRRLIGAPHAPQPSDSRTFAEELDARGYDLTTLTFSICRKAGV